MYAIIRKNTYDPGKLEYARPALAQFQALHAAQPGYAGSIDIDTGPGQQIIVNLWHSEPPRPRRDDRARTPRATPARTADGKPLPAPRVRRSKRQRPDIFVTPAKIPPSLVPTDLRLDRLWLTSAGRMA